MVADHYATLGVSPNSSRAAIRAAYLELMRRYHPDKNPSKAASIRVREITAAYAVLVLRERRSKYNLERARSRQKSAVLTTWHAWRAKRWPLAYLTGAIAMLLVPLFASLPPGPAVGSKQTRTLEWRQAAFVQTASQTASESAAPNPDVLCSTPPSDLIKRELLRRAAQLSRSNVRAFDNIAEHLLIRIESPVLARASESPAMATCQASIAVELPSGPIMTGAQTHFTGTIGYSAQATTAHPGSSINFIHDEPIVAVLATLLPMSGIYRADRSVQPNSRLRNEPPSLPAASALPAPLERRKNTEPRPAVAQQDPSFSCRNALSWAATSVCNSSSLAALDRKVASYYGLAMEGASASEQAQLAQNDRRFLARRDSCASEDCIQSAYLTQLEELRNVLSDQQPDR